MSRPLDIASDVIRAELLAVHSMLERMDSQFDAAIRTIMEMHGRVVVLGMGKSGIIGQKIAATLASTGTPSFFVHPGEAFHGDLGMIKPDDVALMISNSGESEEIIRLLPFLQHQGNKIIALTGAMHSSLGMNAHHILDVGVMKEACVNNLAPTSSTTCTLVMGDAIAVALSKLKNFQPEDFARFHPGGSLGRRLLTRVKDVMHKTNLPTCSDQASFNDVVKVITTGRLGIAIVMSGGSLQGVITDGDIRRALDNSENPLALHAIDIMTRNPITVNANEKFSTAEDLMRKFKVNTLVAIDEKQEVSGVLQIFDL